MGLFTRWFGPKCPRCGERFDQEWEIAGERMCRDCASKIEAKQRAEAAETRRKQEEEARAKFESSKSFGGDTRYKR